MTPTTPMLLEVQRLQQMFSSRRSLNDHIRNVHENTDNTKFLCITCGHRSISSSNLGKHMLTHGGVVERQPRKKLVYPCPVCDKVYRQKRTLTHHVKQKHKEETQDKGQGDKEV